MSSRVLGISLGLFLVTLGAFLQIGHVYLRPFIKQQLHDGIRGQVIWQPDSPPDVRGGWCEFFSTFFSSSPPFPSSLPPTDRFVGSDKDPVDYVRIYMLNITNVGDVRSGTAKPVLQEVGPYTFTKYHRKVNVSFSEDNLTVYYNEFFSLHPVPELTVGSLDDLVTTLNVPLIGAIEAIMAKAPSRFSSWLQYLARLVEGWRDPRVQGLFTTRPVGELLFGYEDPLLSRLRRLLPGMGINPLVALVPNMTADKETHPDMKEQDSARTGLDDITTVGQFERWHGMSEITAWRPPHVEEVQGTDATQFKPGLRKGDALKVWVGDVFRWFTLIEGFGPGADNPRVGNVPVLRFRPDPTQRDPDPRYYQSIPGLMNVTAPMAAQMGGIGPPLFLSLPGYCYADEILTRGVEGIECDHLKHDIHIDVEPTTGLALAALKTLMLNSWFGQRYKAVDPHVQDTYLPIFWVHESTEATPELLQGFWKLLLANKAIAVFESSFAAAGAGIALVGMAVTLLVSMLVIGVNDGEVGRVVGHRDGNAVERRPLLLHPQDDGHGDGGGSSVGGPVLVHRLTDNAEMLLMEEGGEGK